MIEIIRTAATSDPTYYILDCESNSVGGLITELNDAASKEIFFRIDHPAIVQELKKTVEDLLKVKYKKITYSSNLLMSMELLYRTCPYVNFPELEIEAAKRLGFTNESDKFSTTNLEYDTLVRWELILRLKHLPTMDSNVSVLLHRAWSNLSNNIAKQQKGDSPATLDQIKYAFRCHAERFVTEKTLKSEASNKEFSDDNSYFLSQLESVNFFGTTSDQIVNKKSLYRASKNFYTEQCEKFREMALASKTPENSEIAEIFNPEMLPLLTVVHEKWPNEVKQILLNEKKSFDLLSICHPACGAWVLHYLTQSKETMSQIKQLVIADLNENSVISVFLYLINNPYTDNTLQFYQKLSEQQKIYIYDYVRTDDYQLVYEIDPSSKHFCAISSFLFNDSLRRSELIQLSTKQMMYSTLSEQAPVNCLMIKNICDTLSARQHQHLEEVLIDFLQNTPDRLSLVSFLKDYEWAFSSLFNMQQSKIAWLMYADPDVTFYIISTAIQLSIQQPNNRDQKEQLKNIMTEFINVYKTLKPGDQQVLFTKLFLSDRGNYFPKEGIITNLIKLSRSYKLGSFEVPEVTADNIQLLYSDDESRYCELVDYDLLIPLVREVFKTEHILQLLSDLNFPVTFFGAILRTPQSYENLNKYYSKMANHKEFLIAPWFNNFNGKIDINSFYSEASDYEGTFNVFIKLAKQYPLNAGWISDNIFNNTLRDKFYKLYYKNAYCKNVLILCKNSCLRNHLIFEGDFLQNWYRYDKEILKSFNEKFKGMRSNESFDYPVHLICMALQKSDLLSVTESHEQAVHARELEQTILTDHCKQASENMDKMQTLVTSYAIKEIFEILDSDDLTKIKDLATHLTDNMVILYIMHILNNVKKNDLLTRLLHQECFQSYERALGLLTCVYNLLQTLAHRQCYLGQEKIYMLITMIESSLNFDSNILSLLQCEAKYRVITLRTDSELNIQKNDFEFYANLRNEKSINAITSSSSEGEFIKILQEDYFKAVMTAGVRNELVCRIRNANILTIEDSKVSNTNISFVNRFFGVSDVKSPRERIDAELRSSFNFSCG